MAKTRGGASVQKREREQKKRDRQLRKAAKNAKKKDSWPPPEGEVAPNAEK